jgi:Helix-turn-helix domain
MSSYRFSIIPAAAVTDRNLEPRDLQVLCLIGRHTDRNGWCRRSQVKMAVELGCGRATVQRSLDRLYDAGYLQRRLEGTRNGEPPAEGEQPFRAHSYRVLMDREAAVSKLAEVEGVPVDEHRGVLIDGQGVPAIDGHGVPTHTRAPIEGPSFKGTPLNSESEVAETGSAKEPVVGAGKEPISASREQINCSATEHLPASNALAEFQAAWGSSAATDSLQRTMRAWAKLTIEDRHAAIAAIPAFKNEMKRAKRSIPIAGWRYLEERRWELLQITTDAASASIDVKPLSREWWALLLHKIETGANIRFYLQHTLSTSTPLPCRREQMPSLDLIASLESYPVYGEVAAAWRPWLEARGVRVFARDALCVFLPGAQPPANGSVWMGVRHEA